MRRADPFERPLDRLLRALDTAFGPEARRLLPDVPGYSYEIACPACAAPGRTATVTEVGEHGGPLAFGTCSAGCSVAVVRESAGQLTSFFVDGRDAVHLPLKWSPVDGWLVVLPLDHFAELLEERA
jgi:hypothetical protein